jgi:glutamate dehydrogenase
MTIVQKRVSPRPDSRLSLAADSRSLASFRQSTPTRDKWTGPERRRSASRLQMSDTTQAATGRVREESPVVDAVCRQLERQVDPTDAEVIVDFAQLFFSKATPEFLQGRSTDALSRMTLGAFRFLQRSRPEVVDVEVFNPDVDNEGWYAPVTVIRTNISERPFVVDSLREFLHNEEVAIDHLIYPVIGVERNEAGEIVRLGPSESEMVHESLVHCEVTRIADESALEELRTETARRLQDVVRATDDFHPMIDAVNKVVASLAERMGDLPEHSDEMHEAQDFLRWLRDGAFVFLGYRGYDLFDIEGGPAICVEPGSGLGVLRNEGVSQFSEPVLVSEMEESIQELVMSGPLLIISKTNTPSTVHRLARMDYIGVKKLDTAGNVLGEHRFIGLFTSRAYQEAAENIPILREKLRNIIGQAGAKEGSHDYKEIYTIFNSLPKEELFLTSSERIGQDIQVVLTTYHAEGVRVTLREDPLRRGGSVMVILPKDKFSGDARKSIEDMLVDRLDAEVLNYRLALGEGDQARMHFHLATDVALTPDLASEIEVVIKELTRSWAERIRARLERVRPSDEARRLVRAYADSFSPEYRAATKPKTAVRDILELEAMLADERDISIWFSNSGDEEEQEGEYTELKVYLRNGRLILSDFMPILENLGLRVIAVTPYTVDGDESLRTTIYSFQVQDSSGEIVLVKDRASLMARTIMAVRRGDATNDSLNALVMAGGLAWREADVLRAYAAYAFQLGIAPSRMAMPGALVSYPEIAASLFDLYSARFDPARFSSMDERRAEVDRIHDAITVQLNDVKLLADDRALKRLRLLMMATVRTNYFRNGGSTPTRTSGGVPYVSFKLAMTELLDVAKTRLLFEVSVHSSRMEGIHLRGASVARGGIRYSDRPDDFRTEILGLVNTQMVKNAVIVPHGSKGGFITLRSFPDREAMGAEAKEQYKTLQRGLLDLTDNLDGAETVPPPDVVCWDDPDPYLVVAADKGTATYSDVANGISAEYGFWLDDAFASGGSQGYDHKKVGITARGGWESVKRHFLEIGKDIQSEDFTVVGIGDMSGDVFGNGMLLSRHIKLIAAFDHRHVFIDPDPDAEISFLERERLFNVGRSSWDDYDRSKLSEGAMIVPRGSKEVELTPQAREALGISEDAGTFDGESLIRTVLRSEVELLWNGGIGTYVKAPHQTDADAGDPSNDAVRVDCSELRCQVVGEGGNLGFTQEARIHFALNGGLINTDALDNSGGVDLSDREVNLKIFLSPAVQDGRLSQDERNSLLEELTDSVAALVLTDNEAQSLAISLDLRRATEGVDDFRDLMSALEKKGSLDRAAEHLPTWEALHERMENTGLSLSRPELCVLLSYAKLDLKGQLLASGLPDDPATEGYLRDYFPAAATARAGEDDLFSHRLRREIVTSQFANDLIDLMGSTFINRITRDTGRSAAEVARAWLIGARLAGHDEIVATLRGGKAGLSAEAGYRWMLGLSRVLERTTRWLLANVGPERKTAVVISENWDALSSLRHDFGDIVAGDDRGVFESRVSELVSSGASTRLAKRLITLRFLDQLLEILRVARETETDAITAGHAYYQVSDVLDVPWLRHTAFGVANDDRWEQRAAQALAEDLSRAHHRIAALVAVSTEAPTAVSARELLRSRADELDRFRALVADVREEENVSLSGLSVAIREVSRLAEKVSLTPQ